MKQLQSFAMIVGCLLACTSQMSSQNLVPNPGFEIAQENPTYNPAGVSPGPEWFVHKGTPDFFHRSYRDYVSPPNNFRGYQEPATGEGYAGIITTPSLEHLPVKLIEPLEEGQIYEVSFKVSISEGGGSASDAIGLIFLDEDPREVGIMGKYSIRNEPGRVISDTLGWTTIRGQYLARGTEQYLLIGNLAGDRDVVEPLRPGDETLAYFFVDDVFVGICEQHLVTTEVSDTIICEGTSVALSGMSDAVNYFWDGAGINRTISISEAGRYMVDNHYDCSVIRQIFEVAVADCDCSIAITNLILSGGQLQISKSLNVQAFDFMLFDGAGNFVTRTTDQTLRNTDLPLNAGAYFWRAKISCFGANDQLHDRMVSGKFFIQ